MAEQALVAAPNLDPRLLAILQALLAQQQQARPQTLQGINPALPIPGQAPPVAGPPVGPNSAPLFNRG